MKQTVNFSQFCDEFRAYDRQEQFTYQGLRHLYGYLVELEQETGHEIGLDVVALCCDYEEEFLDKVLEKYGLDNLQELHDRTSVVNFCKDSGLVVFRRF